MRPDCLTWGIKDKKGMVPRTDRPLKVTNVAYTIMEKKLLPWMSGTTCDDHVRKRNICQEDSIAPIVEKLSVRLFRWNGNITRTLAKIGLTKNQPEINRNTSFTRMKLANELSGIPYIDELTPAKVKE